MLMQDFSANSFCLDVLDCAVSKWGKSYQPGLTGERVELGSPNDQGWIWARFHVHGTFVAL